MNAKRQRAERDQGDADAAGAGPERLVVVHSVDHEWTVPVGWPMPKICGVTVAVKVSAWP